jgi:membrane-anchored protein YejM (alkaline phosphatase superfamily)
VPLVIHAPGLSSQVSNVDYQHTDFGATLTDILGLPPLNCAEGVSAFSEEHPQRDKVVIVNNVTFVYNEEEDGWQFSKTE